MMIQLYQRPGDPVAADILEIATLLTTDWFTTNVPEDTRRDLLFQDAFCLYENGELRSFLVFTSWDGCLHITLMGTHPDYHGCGYGSRLMERFLQHARDLGFAKAVALTVPPEVKSAYRATMAFYRKHGFVETRCYHELWENGAVELVKDLASTGLE
ncbi:MAG TPA: GNAT family N-acetyltransferase [Anaerolineae bacterium]|nr:GNAT family N-acetyltransferase [Anaerolineae bacterium]